MAQVPKAKDVKELINREEEAKASKIAINGKDDWQPADGAGVLPEDVWNSLDVKKEGK